MEKMFLVADHCFSIIGERALAALESLPGFAPFSVQDGSPEFSFMEGDDVPSLETSQYTFAHEGVEVTFGLHSEGHILQMKPTEGEGLNLWTTAGSKITRMSGDFSSRLYNYALWVGYGLMTLAHNTVAIHSSCIVWGNEAVLFLGESGTGKSTHTGLWRRHIEGASLLNDDSPIIRAMDGKIWAYGSPWSGKTACHRQERHQLAGCVRLSQAPANRIQRLPILQSYAALHPSCPPTFAYDAGLYDCISDTIGSVLTSVPVYHLACRPDEEAARLAHSTIFQK